MSKKKISAVEPTEAFIDDGNADKDAHYAMGHEEGDDDDDFDLDDEDPAEDCEEQKTTYSVSSAKMAKDAIPEILSGLVCKFVTFTTMPSNRSVVCEIVSSTGHVYLGAAKATTPDGLFDVSGAQKIAAEKAVAQLKGDK